MNFTNSTNAQKHTSSNPIQRWLINRFYDQLLTTIANLDINTILDAGCGEGFTISRLEKTYPNQFNIHGIDNSPEAIAIAKQTTPFADLQVANVNSLPFPDNLFDLIICNEVLEHLKDPRTALQEIHRVSRTYALLSVPNEPWFRGANFLRGRHLAQLGNHPEHIQNWTSRAFQDFIYSCGFMIEKTHHPFPWTMVLVRKSETPHHHTEP